ncbi:MAG: aldehyde dehydrogenase family protein [Xanthomonadales bacterium]|nr:aldehyde dehydrogenase family protein [Xanthomonadales bacterium]
MGLAGPRRSGRGRSPRSPRSSSAGGRHCSRRSSPTPGGCGSRSSSFRPRSPPFAAGRTEAPALLEPPRPAPSNIPFIEAELRLEPYALVGVISPWNFPLLLALIDAIPALAAGSAVLVKPSELTLRFLEPLTAALAELPPLAAVLDFARGGPETGAALLEQVDLLCFTGSVATGRTVGEACMRRLIPCFLELGGKDPALVFADADLPRAARAIAWGGLVNAGQSCMSIERVYVEAEAYEPFLAALVGEVQRLRLNDEDPARGEIGPIIAERQVAVIEAQLEDAYARGARALTGGRIVERHGGLWCEPTVLVEVDHGMRILREETFGPILPVMPFASEEEAILLANDSDYGLSAAVFSADPERAERVAARLRGGGDLDQRRRPHQPRAQRRRRPAARPRASEARAWAPPRSCVSCGARPCSAIPGVEDPWWFPR